MIGNETSEGDTGAPLRRACQQTFLPSRELPNEEDCPAFPFLCPLLTPPSYSLLLLDPPIPSLYLLMPPPFLPMLCLLHSSPFLALYPLPPACVLFPTPPCVPYVPLSLRIPSGIFIFIFLLLFLLRPLPPLPVPSPFSLSSVLSLHSAVFHIPRFCCFSALSFTFPVCILCSYTSPLTHAPCRSLLLSSFSLSLGLSAFRNFF